MLVYEQRAASASCVPDCLLQCVGTSADVRSAARVTSRTAVYGPVRTVVWEGGSREAPPYPDQQLGLSRPIFPQISPPTLVRPLELSALEKLGGEDMKLMIRLETAGSCFFVGDPEGLPRNDLRERGDRQRMATLLSRKRAFGRFMWARCAETDPYALRCWRFSIRLRP